MTSPIEGQFKFIKDDAEVIKKINQKQSNIYLKICIGVCFVGLIVLGFQVNKMHKMLSLNQGFLNLETVQKELNTSLSKTQLDIKVSQQASQKSTSTAKLFKIPKNVWVFIRDPKKQSFFTQRCLKNIQYYSNLSQFKITFLNFLNYQEYLSKEKVQKVENFMKILQQRKIKQWQSNLKDHISKIRQNLITLQILNQRGGILVSKNILFTQNFDWIEQINSNIYVNKGLKSTEAKYIAFYNIDHGSIPKKQYKLNITYETQSYMIKFPSVQPYFLVAKQKEEYLSLVLESYYVILQNPTTLRQKIKKEGYDLGVVQGYDVYYQALMICFQMVLQDKQRQLDAEKSFFQIFAIDYFGLFTINQRYFPKKLQYIFQSRWPQKIYTNLAKYTIEQLQQTVGPLRYILQMPLQKDINYLLEKTYSTNKKYNVHPHSFIAKNVILNNSQTFIIKKIQKPFVEPQHRPWTALPRILWLFWDTGIQNSGIGNILCFENLKRSAEAANFQLREVTNANVQQYLGPQIIAKIKGFISNKKVQTFAQTVSNFVRISLIAKYGGVYMDASFISLQSFQWIVNIANYPSQYIFNRYGKLPRTCMIFHPHYGHPLQWQYDQVSNTKKMFKVGYQNNLMFAEPNQQIFWLWFEEYGKFITTPYDETEKLMEQHDVWEEKWTESYYVYLACMDSLRIVMGKKNTELLKKMRQPQYKGPRTSAEYFGIWSFSGYRGQQKFRQYTNFDNIHYKTKDKNHDNVFLWRYPQSYTEGVLGRPQQLIKMYGQNIVYLNALFLASFDSGFHSEIHPESFLSKYLYNQSIGTIKKVGDQLTLLSV